MSNKVIQEGSAKAVLYLRVSSERQARSGGEKEGYSIPAQREAGKRKATSLGAEVVAEYVDAGASAKTADRAGLQTMLARLEKQQDIDYVIIHKLDRLARSRMDDVLIMASIERAGAKLISCTENIDASPQGQLLHGIMASMAEFYIQNLATEAKKGLHEKAKRGGTPGRAPIGYLNDRATVEGVVVKTITFDKERAGHILWAFESYATGQWSISELAEELERRGLRSRATRRYVGAPLNRSQLHRLLSNPYYMGKVRYGGVVYEGRHDALIDEETFQVVQDMLAGRKVAGDRSWRQQQYLKGTVFCHRCGERLGFSYNTGKSGQRYGYFFCLGRHRRRTDCDLPYLPADKTEQAVVSEWQDTSFSPSLLAGVRSTIGTEFKQMLQRDRIIVADQKKRLVQLERRREKLLDGYEDGIIAKSDFIKRQERVDRELRDARTTIAKASNTHETMRGRIKVMLELMKYAGLLYRILPDAGRQALNQVRFVALFIDIDDHGKVMVVDRELTDVMEAAEAVVDEVRPTVGEPPRRFGYDLPANQSQRAERRHLRPSGYREASPHRQLVERRQRWEPKNPDHLVGARGSNLTYLAEGEGFEPSVPG